jgi:hypothetical protein
MRWVQSWTIVLPGQDSNAACSCPGEAHEGPPKTDALGAEKAPLAKRYLLTGTRAALGTDHARTREVDQDLHGLALVEWVGAFEMG